MSPIEPMHAGSWLPKRLAACALIAAAAWLPEAAAEDLLRVYEAAQAHDAALRAADAQWRSATPRAAQAQAALRPTASANGAWTASSISDDATPATGSTRTASVDVSYRHPLYRPAGKAQVAKANAELGSARLDFELAVQEFILRVAQTYFDALSAQDVLTASQANRQLLADQLLAAQRRFAAGTGTVTDVRDSQARHDLAVAQELAAQNDVQLSRRALARLAGRSDVTPEPPALPFVPLAPEPGDLQSWLAKAAGHPAVSRARLAVEAARQEVARIKADRLPTIDAVGSAGVARTRGPNLPNTGNTRTASLGIELSLALFSGGLTQNQIAEAQVLLEKALNDHEAARQTVAGDTEAAYFALQSNLAKVPALETAEASSRASLAGTIVAFKAGVRVNLDVLNAQSLLFQAQRDLAKARYEALLGYLALHRAVGELELRHLITVNGLLVGKQTR